MTARTSEQALAYARRGWPVFPCQPGRKEPATRHGFLDATTDPDKITWWWRRQPDANLAIATATIQSARRTAGRPVEHQGGREAAS